MAKLVADRYAASTVRQAHRVFSLILDLALRDGRLPRNPATGVRLPRAAKGEPVFLSHAQVEELALACPGYGLFVRVLHRPALGRTTAVRVRRLDLMKRRIEVVHTAVEINTSADRSRSPRSLVDALAEHVAGKGPDDLVFTTPRGR